MVFSAAYQVSRSEIIKKIITGWWTTLFFLCSLLS